MNLAAFQFTQGDMDAARVSFYEALERAESAFGPNHPQIAVFLTNIGRFHLAAEEPATAKEVLIRARRILRDALGRPHRAIASAASQLARAHEALDELEAARESYLEVIAIDEALMGPEDPAMAQDLEDFADFLDRVGDTEEANTLRARAEALRAAQAEKEASGSDQ